MKKAFDCVEMKRKAQQRIHDETRELSREEQLAYFHEAGEQFWRDIQVLRRKGRGRKSVAGHKTRPES